MTKDAERRLDQVRGLRFRLLRDRGLQNVAWHLADAVNGLVTAAPIEALS